MIVTVANIYRKNTYCKPGPVPRIWWDLPHVLLPTTCRDTGL